MPLLTRVKLIFRISFLFIILSSFFYLYHPQEIKADIATGSDWIGLFPVYTTGDFLNEQTDASIWWYTGNSALAPCTQTPSSPFLSGNCSFNTNSLTPGAYEYRLNINGTGAMLAQSKVVWRNITVTATPTNCGYLNQRIDINWAASPAQIPVGITSLTITRNPAFPAPGYVTPNISDRTYPDSSIAALTNYTYTIQTCTSRRDSSNNPICRNYITNSAQCGLFANVDPWLEVNDGDVHSNTEINLPVP